MEETGHGRNNRTSSAGAQGLMQFMPATWRSMGVDGDGDCPADIHNDADSVHSAANYLTKSGVNGGAAGVRRAFFVPPDDQHNTVGQPWMSIRGEPLADISGRGGHW
jgi:membrane-bound lytic murein transglycosylase B